MTTINLHIERLVLEGLELGPGQGDLVRAAVAAELARLLTEGGLTSQFQSGVALPSVRAGTIRIAPASEPAQLGGQIAQAVYGGIGEMR
jgi:sirohydrochlorin ferrochelatase